MFHKKIFLSLVICVVIIFFLSSTIKDICGYIHDKKILAYAIAKIPLRPENVDIFPYESFNIVDFLSTQKYLKKIATNKKRLFMNSVDTTKMGALLNNARIGEAIGFITENVGSQSKIIKTFPNGVINIKQLVNDLATNVSVAPYGKLNNNYLTASCKKLIYSDDSDLTGVLKKTMLNLSKDELLDYKFFLHKLALNLRQHWLQMKSSGQYGKDGLHHGKRGYGRRTLLTLSKLSKKRITKGRWWDVGQSNSMGNGSLLRAFVVGADKRLDTNEAFQLGKIQSEITHPNKDIMHASGAIAALFNRILFSHKEIKKEYLMENFIKDLNSNKNSRPYSLYYAKLGIDLAKKQVNPILVYNEFRGRVYYEFILLISYSFMYFDNFIDALDVVVHTTGDNDTLAFVLGAAFGAYYGVSLPKTMLGFVEDNYYLMKV
ncbi:MAG: ADP-ribosylglycohydrolase family protein [Rickettsiales bacterium]|nr:ADP-ribosylglycohydrolase family protein [Rickettsiales bacterium]